MLNAIAVQKTFCVFEKMKNDLVSVLSSFDDQDKNKCYDFCTKMFCKVENKLIVICNNEF